MSVNLVTNSIRIVSVSTKDKTTYPTKINFGSLACGCNTIGSKSTVCDKMSGQCTCKDNIEGLTCGSCIDGRFGFPFCEGKYYNQIQGIEEINLIPS